MCLLLLEDQTLKYQNANDARTTAALTESAIGPTRSARAVGTNTNKALSERCAVAFCCARTVTASLRSKDRPKDGAEHACSGIMLRIAVNGKAVHGTGGVNCLPHMLAFYRVAAAVFWLKATIARLLFRYSTGAAPCAFACAAIADDREPFKEKITSTVSVHSESGPKGSGGPKAGFRREVSLLSD